ncbi:probable 2-oxoglutarate dehydrogenase E1 component DHKTD1, mitochondrial [Anneissia japonica]|uniref:probable 2-oxoglutarate dehydrogenase E1 component DHKTD1, mitochondrial n=1 Tax=Anneissia japonica TaxID=1529436 RepID=UPI001425B55E|nr:probable 2-oxoglutarate dehydrogenase E1 component DHKTD1, mitochondrial [Anneissia japonica]
MVICVNFVSKVTLLFTKFIDGGRYTPVVIKSHLLYSILNYVMLSTSTWLRSSLIKRLPRLPRASYHAKTGIYGYNPSAQQMLENNQVNEVTLLKRIQNSSLVQLVEAYRRHGHKKATIDPLGLQVLRPTPELNPELYGLERSNKYDLSGILNTADCSSVSLEGAVAALESIYCSTTSAEFAHLETLKEREWFAQKFEESRTWQLSDDEKKKIASLLVKSQAFDNFVANKFTTVKRYSGEGAESMMAFFNELFSLAAQSNIEQVMIAIAHRGRLNLLTGLLDFPTELMIRKMQGKMEYPDTAPCTGDVLSHLYQSVDIEYEGKQVHVSLIPNPSHLEANVPVVIGKVRGRQQTLQEGDYSSGEESVVGEKVLCVQVHGDAALSAQGVIQESLGLWNLPHYRVGGSIHLVVNNQLGFTTPAEQGRSSLYSTDIAKINDFPVLHVNGDHPEEVVKAVRLAMSYRQTFGKDVFVDLMCFRRWGHNELDNPSFTNPSMYSVIDTKPSVPDAYVDKLSEEGIIDKKDIAKEVSLYQDTLNNSLKEAETYQPKQFHLQAHWKGFVDAPSHITTWDTGVDPELLRFIAAKSVEVPENFKVHSTLLKSHIGARMKKLEEGTSLDWATAEAMAIGSLLAQGFNVRISGQDIGRGTFSHRHAMLIEQDSNSMYIPFNNIVGDQRHFLEVANSPLSEEAVLAFEYGMSIENPKSLIIWEAQFGDFYNGAQIIIDTYVTAGEVKWLLQSGLVMMLPHGFDGAGPEHSSCHMERFLQACDSKENGIDGDNVNIQLVHPTTPAQYFHLLRRQMVRNFRKPLIMASPKVLLRLPAATSSLSELAPGTSFQPVIGDQLADSNKVDKVIVCCGKHYYALVNERQRLQADNIAIVRVEQLCPFPAEEIQKNLSKFPNAQKIIWSQEEHQNMGAWFFVAPRFTNLVGCNLSYAGRGPLGTPAVGVGQLHQEEVKMVMEKTFSL